MEAANRFYMNLLVYQWRLEALDAELETCDAAARRAAVVAQRDAALAALTARAGDYALLVGAGAEVRLSERGERRQLERLVHSTYESILAEASELGAVAAADVESLRRSRERRRVFWNRELEELWDAWQQATAEMHGAAEELREVWGALTAAVLAAEDLARENATLGSWSGLLSAVAAVVAMALRWELLRPLGLVGLTGDCEAEARRTVAASAVALLADADALAEAVDRLLKPQAALPQAVLAEALKQLRAPCEPLPPLWSPRAVLAHSLAAWIQRSQGEGAETLRPLGGEALVVFAAAAAPAAAESPAAALVRSAALLQKTLDVASLLEAPKDSLQQKQWTLFSSF